MPDTNKNLQKAVLCIDCQKGAGREKMTDLSENKKADFTADTFSLLHQNKAGQGKEDKSAVLENKDAKNGMIEVQYNPASLKYRAGISDDKGIKNDMEGGQNVQITTITSESSVDMSFTLVFHRQSPKDCAVRQQMDQMIDMIRNSPTKWIDFSWSDIHMEGKLVSFSGTYDMFDNTGEPVSGHMDLTIEASMKSERADKIIDNLEDKHKDKLKKQDEAV